MTKADAEERARLVRMVARAKESDRTAYILWKAELRRFDRIHKVGSDD